jgi:hypothetical protein
VPGAVVRSGVDDLGILIGLASDLLENGNVFIQVSCE